MKKRNERNVRRETGITLIALIVTIIVLLILAGISINLVLGQSGMLTRTEQAKVTTEEAKIKEEIELAWGNVQIDKIVNNWDNEKTSEAMENELKKEDSNVYVALDDTTLNIEYKGFATTIDLGAGEVGTVAKVYDAGLYETGTDKLLIPWEELIKEGGPIVFEDGKVSTHFDSSTNENSSSDILDGKLVFDNSVTSIDNYGFMNCTKLTGIKLSNNLQTIGHNSFNNCTALSGDLIIPNKVTTVGGNAFYGCTALNGRLVIPNSVTTLVGACFINVGANSELESLEINMTTIQGNGSFSGVKSKSFKLGSSVRTITDGSFQGCTGIKGDLIFPEGVTTIGGGAFNGCTGFNGKMVLPSSLETVGNQFGAGGVFSGVGKNDKGLSSVEINMKDIPSALFAHGAIKADKLILGDNVRTIGSSAFLKCSEIKGDLIIHDKIEKVEMSAFLDCTGFNGKLEVRGVNTELATAAFLGVGKDEGLESVTINARILPTSLFIGGVRTKKLTLGEGVEKIEAPGFSGSSEITGDLVLPSTLLEMQAHVFKDCTGFNSITIKNNVRAIGDDAFKGVKQIYYTGTLTSDDNWGAVKLN